MIYLDINTPKTCVFTLYSKCINITNPYFTFTIKNKETSIGYTFSQLDYSFAPYYWNAFTFSISNTQSGLTSGIINAPNGMYDYKVYEMPTPYNLNIASASGIVDNGILTIIGTFSTFNINSFVPTINVNNNLDYI